MSSSPPLHSSHVYIECDVPDGMTLTDWRRGLNDQRATSLLSRVLRRMTRTPSAARDLEPPGPGRRRAATAAASSQRELVQLSLRLCPGTEEARR